LSSFAEIKTLFRLKYVLRKLTVNLILPAPRRVYTFAAQKGYGKN
jgi:hypothetical protein